MVCMYLNVGILYYKLELILWNITNWALHSPSPTVKHAVLITIKCEKCTKIIMIFLISNEFKLYNWKWHHSPHSAEPMNNIKTATQWILFVCPQA